MLDNYRFNTDDDQWEVLIEGNWEVSDMFANYGYEDGLARMKKIGADNYIKLHEYPEVTDDEKQGYSAEIFQPDE